MREFYHWTKQCRKTARLFVTPWRKSTQNAKPFRNEAMDKSLETESPTKILPVFFDGITGATIRSAALHLSGSAGPSGLDAAGWRRLCVSFHAASKDLCNAIAALARRLCTQFVDPVSMEAFVACRFIPLNEPGCAPHWRVRMLAETCCQSRTFDYRFLRAWGDRCIAALRWTGAGIEAAIHAMRDIFIDDETEAILLVDARNAFNNLNRQAALFNVNKLCPAIGKILINIFHLATDLHVGGETIKSPEGTTQGDPLAMAMYAVATMPLLRKAQTPSAKQVWFADDGTSRGKLTGLKSWWDSLTSCGPDFGYDINAPNLGWLSNLTTMIEPRKSSLTVTGVNITAAGGRHLGAALGSKPFVAKYLEEKIARWTSEVKTLAKFAVTQPHASYAAFTHGLSSHWTYLCRTMPGVAPLLQPVEDIIRTELIPAMLGCGAPGDPERAMLALPARLGGLGLTNPVHLTDCYDHSVKLTAPLAEQIKEQTPFLGDIPAEKQLIKQQIHQQRRAAQVTEANRLKASLTQSLQRSVSLAAERGASTWLSALPLAAHGFHLSKSEFRDAIHLRYGWPPQNLPSQCACGKPFDANHALSCPTGGLPTIRHNKIRDLCAVALTRVCHNVATEPDLEPLQGEQFRPASTATTDGALLDISASGFWGGGGGGGTVRMHIFWCSGVSP